jgi:hypothetical protein
MPRFPGDLRSALTELDRSPSPELVTRLAASGDRRFVPFLLPCLAGDERLRTATAAAIESLLRGASPSALAQIDDYVRTVPEPYEFKARHRWRRLDEPALSPDTVRMLRFIFRTT